MSQVWQAGRRQALTTDVVGLSSVMASSSRGGEDFAACMLGAVDLPVSIPLERWEVDAGTGASAEVVQSNMLRFAALADGVDSFDAAAFRLAPAEAAAMDPQQRILLEQTYGALQVLPYPASYSVQFSPPDIGNESSPFLRKDGSMTCFYMSFSIHPESPPSALNIGCNHVQRELSQATMKDRGCHPAQKI